MSVEYTSHAQVQAQQRSISPKDIERTIRTGKRTSGKANKTVLTDTINNIVVVAVGLSRTRWLVITVYRLI